MGKIPTDPEEKEEYLQRLHNDYVRRVEKLASSLKSKLPPDESFEVFWHGIMESAWH